MAPRRTTSTARATARATGRATARAAALAGALALAIGLAGPASAEEEHRPTAPRAVKWTTDAGARTARISWHPPEAFEPWPLTGYVVSRWDASNRLAERVAVPVSARWWTFRDLADGRHTLAVRAVTRAFDGDEVREHVWLPEDKRTVPGAPQRVTARALDETSIGVAWRGPEDGVTSPVTEFRIRVYRGTEATPFRSEFTTTRSGSYHVRGLTNGAPYTVDVAAMNAIGTGPASARSAVVRPHPGAVPTSFVATKTGDRSATLTWTSAQPNSPDPITGWRIRAVRYPAATPEDPRPDPVTVHTSAILAVSQRSYVVTIPAAGVHGFAIEGLHPIGLGERTSNTLTFE